jgi:hypothetical protein
MAERNASGPAPAILVFQERGSGEKKIAGIERYAPGEFRLEVFSIDDPLPALIDDPDCYLPEKIEADIVLGFLRHPDLVAELFRRCREAKIPLVASARKYPAADLVATPPI